MSTKIRQEEFEKIYRETYDKTLKFIIIKCKDIEDVNDIIQDTYIELLRKLKKAPIETENPHNYIIGIANNIIKRYYTKKKKNNIILYYQKDEEENITIKDNFDLEQSFITKENVKQVWEYIKSKDLNTIKIFYLYFVFGLKILEISKELDINQSTIKNKIYRTLKEIKNKIGKDVIEND